MNRLPFLLLSVLLLPCSAIVTASPPNVIVIVSDDQGYRDLGCFGSDEVLTPHLDKLATQGVKLTNFYVSWPACTPSRASLLTGRYPQRNGIEDMIRNEAPDYGYLYKPAEYRVTFERIGGMDTREILLPKMLGDAGYTSAIFGKWDLGSLRRYLPLQKGFDRFYGFVNTGIDYFTHERYGVPSMYRDNEPTEADKGTYCTDLFLREAKSFLRDTHDQPFFLYLPFNAPHGASNLDPLIRSAAQSTEKYEALYPQLAAQAGTQESTKYGRPAQTLNRAAKRLRYVASITQMDDAIGDVLAMLDEYKIADNTLVVFFSDNGGGGGSDNQPLKGGKGDMFEGGIRVPAIVRYSPSIPAGSVSDAFCTSLDLVPTVTKLCGVELDKELKIDGYDMLPTWSGKSSSPRTKMFWQRQSDRAARVGNWKWVESKKGKGLFDLSTDIGEKNDLSKERLDKLKELTDAFNRWRTEMDAAEPREPFDDF
jgi:arylsulfatase A